MNWFLKDKSADNHISVRQATGPLVRISDALADEAIIVFNSELSKRDLYSKLVDVLKVPEPDITLRSILAREQIGSTIIEKGVALPHARVHGLTRIHAALGIIPSSEMSICLLFAGPTDDMKGHLAFLASSAALFQDRELRQSLLRLSTGAAILERIREAERKSTVTDR